MSAEKYQIMTEDELQHFYDKGFVIVEEAFPREVAKEWTDRAFVRLGYDPDDPATWTEGKIHMPRLQNVKMKEFTPKAWAYACDLMGGEERILDPDNVLWGDSFIANFHFEAHREWEPPSPQSKGWHKDGDFFRHYLDSPEQGLLTIVIWSDIGPKGGGTFVACDSVGPVARYLREHPAGVHPMEQGFGHLINQCSDFGELTGKAGTVALIHPFLLHSSSQNISGIPRFITNPPVKFKEPMNFNRKNPDDFSPVEIAILKGLGVDRLDFQITGEREKIVPERVKRQAKMAEEEKARLTQRSE